MRRSIPTLIVISVASGALYCASAEERVAAPAADAAPSSSAPVDATAIVVPDDARAGCTNLQCNIQACDGGQKTRVTGTVYAPNGMLPLYNAIVYVPNKTVDPLPSGVTCDRCGTLVSGQPVAATLSDAHGRFVLEDVPVGKDIPLVMQIGKWRRTIRLPEVVACTDNLADPSDTQTDPKLRHSEITRLPRNQTEGDMPRIAVTTGGCDPIPCLLPKIGIDPVEYGAGLGPKAVNFYDGFGGSGPGSPPPAQELWSDLERLKKYDVVLHSCECEEHDENKGSTAWGAMKSFVDAGGRLLTTDFGYTFIEKAPSPWSEVVTWDPAPDALARAPIDGGEFPINKSFPKGNALADWLDFTNGASSPGNVELPTVFDNAVALDETRGTRWVYRAQQNMPKVLSYNSPVGAPADTQCGRVVFADAHIFSQFENYVGPSFPTGCKAELNDREKVMAFLLFDLASCVVSDLVPPTPPAVIK